jgi:hypothetical protein
MYILLYYTNCESGGLAKDTKFLSLRSRCGRRRRRTGGRGGGGGGLFKATR